MPSNGEQHTDRPDAVGGKQVFTTGEAARICNVSQQTIIRCFDRGRLTGFKVPGSKFRRIPRAELVRFMQQNDIPIDRLSDGRTKALVVGKQGSAAWALATALRSDARFDVRAAETPFDAGLEIATFRPEVTLVGAGADARSLEASLRARADLSEVRVIDLESGHARTALRTDTPGAGDRLRAMLSANGPEPESAA